MTERPGRHAASGRCGTFDWAFVLDVGLQRPTNEDALLVEPLAWPDDEEPLLLVAVADGLGGEGHGGTASALAIDALKALAEAWRARPAKPDWPSIHADLVEAILGADRHIRDAAMTAGHRPGATTLVAAVIGAEAGLHVYGGDSRLYAFGAEGELLYRTADQSLARIYQEAGRPTKGLHLRNTLFSVLGGREGRLSLEPDATPGEALPAARLLPAACAFLLCSDGLWDVVPEDRLGPFAIAAEVLAMDAAERLADEALAAGGPDNIAVVLIRRVKEGEAEDG